jgi:hypothetical protein
MVSAGDVLMLACGGRKDKRVGVKRVFNKFTYPRAVCVRGFLLWSGTRQKIVVPKAGAGNQVDS